MKKELIILLTLIGVFYSCANSNTIPESEWRNVSDLNGEWTELERDQKGYFIYNPCDGETPKISITNDSIVLKHQIETPTELRIEKYSVTPDSIILKTSSEYLNAELIFKIVERNANYILFKWYYPEYKNRGKQIITRSNLAQNFRTVNNPCDNEKVPDQEFLPIEFD